jgi:hypothetical protein
MPRKRTSEAPPPVPTLPPCPLHPRLVLDLRQAASLLGLAPHTLPREAKLGRLRVSRRAGRYFTCGRWLWSWLLAGERRKPQVPDAPSA